jgi:hypothetical protein
MISALSGTNNLIKTPNRAAAASGVGDGTNSVRKGSVLYRPSFKIASGLNDPVGKNIMSSSIQKLCYNA